MKTLISLLILLGSLNVYSYGENDALEKKLPGDPIIVCTPDGGCKTIIIF